MNPHFYLDLTILSYFKVLPTDPRFLSLNFFQKFMLALVINEDQESKRKILTGTLDKMCAYVNPEMFQKEQEYLKTGKLPGQSKNVEFERHQRSARESGIPDVSHYMAQALGTYAKLRQGMREEKEVVYLLGEEGTEVNNPTSFTAPKNFLGLKNNPEELG